MLSFIFFCFFEDPNLAGIDALRLVMLYALRYEDRSGNQTAALKREQDMHKAADRIERMHSGLQRQVC